MKRISILALLLLAAAAVTPARAQGGPVIARDRMFIPGHESLAVRTLQMPRGIGIDLLNRDVVDHSIVSDAITSTGAPLFKSAVAKPGETKAVDGTKALTPGTYPFACSIHPTMRGSLVIFA